MNRKIISLFTLLAFIVFSFSCYTTKTRNVRTAADLRRKKGRILSLVKTSGEYIKFSRNNLGRIYGDSIIGTVIILNKDVEIDRVNIKRIKKDQEGKILRITTKDEKIYHVVTGTAREEEDKIIFSGNYYESVSIPLSEVKTIRGKRLNAFKTFLAVVGSAAGAVALLFVILIADYMIKEAKH